MKTNFDSAKITTLYLNGKMDIPTLDALDEKLCFML